MKELRDHAEALSFPRPTGTSAEARAAAYVRRELRRLGLMPFEEGFLAVRDMNWFPISAAIFTVVGVAVFSWVPWLGISLSAAAPFLLWYALTRADSPLRFLLPRGRSRNVIARVPPRAGERSTVAILAHLDTNRCRGAWSAAGARAVRLGTAITLGVYLLSAASLPAALAGFRAAFSLAALGGAYALVMAAYLVAEMRNPFSAGAIDNASSVAVALGVAEELSRAPLEHTGVWLCFTGAEEVDHRGAKELLVRHPELRDAYFVVLEGVGAGELTLAAEEGVLFRYRPDPELLSLAEGLARARPELGVTTAEMLIVCETQTLRRRGCRAVTLAGRDPVTGTLPHWHSPTDLPENLSVDTMERAREFLIAFLDGIEKLSRGD